jgi:hypothetical protein
MIVGCKFCLTLAPPPIVPPMSSQDVCLAP